MHMIKFSHIKNKFLSRRLIFLIILIIFFQVVQAQKGEVSVSAGPLLPFGTNFYPNVRLKTRLGLEAGVQYNFTNRSAGVAEAGISSFIIKDRTGPNPGTRYRKQINSFKIGYRYTFGETGIYSNIPRLLQYLILCKAIYSALFGKISSL